MANAHTYRRTYVVLGHARWAGAVLLLGLLIHYGGAMMMTAMDLNVGTDAVQVYLVIIALLLTVQICVTSFVGR